MKKLIITLLALVLLSGCVQRNIIVSVDEVYISLGDSVYEEEEYAY